jgi:hypothetical protein
MSLCEIQSSRVIRTLVNGYNVQENTCVLDLIRLNEVWVFETEDPVSAKKANASQSRIKNPP